MKELRMLTQTRGLRKRRVTFEIQDATSGGSSPITEKEQSIVTLIHYSNKPCKTKCHKQLKTVRNYNNFIRFTLI